MTRLNELAGVGQSIWVDYIRRSFLTSGELQELVDQGVRGVTSNPTIFDRAIAGSDDYDAELRSLVEAGRTVEEIYDLLTLADIGRAADLLLPLYEELGGADGFVSVEVNPALAHDTEATVGEARRLFGRLGRPNVMVKVPGTAQGVPAIETLIGEGVNVNVTLLFSLEQYEAVAEAYLAGLERLTASGGDPGRVASVASFFVSRVDTAVDAALDRAGNEELRGTTAVDNARLAYARFQEIFTGARWERLARAGARVQRPLWASTGTKDARYSDTLYVDRLIGPDTVNTVPLRTLRAVLDHGTTAVSVTDDVDGARSRHAALAGLGIDLDAVTRGLQAEGVAAFAASHASLFGTIAAKRARLLADCCPLAESLGALAERVDAAGDALDRDNVVTRVWVRDHTVWRPKPREIVDRLAWLDAPERMSGEVDRLRAFAAGVRADGYTHAVVLGMGGSSLAPEVFGKVFGAPPAHKGLWTRGGLAVTALDTTDPGAVLICAGTHAPASTLYVVSTKSGTTVETLSLFKFFYNRATEILGAGRVGRHFVAITDPGSRLAELAQAHRFRETFLADPNVGGRYSALTHFGLVPAALVGVDLNLLLGRALEATRNGRGAGRPGPDRNRAACLGVTLAELARSGRDKVTFLTSPALASFADWAEQLLAESTGKDGTGLVPVVGEPVGHPAVYGTDRVFVYLRLGADQTHDAEADALEAAGHPVIRLHLGDLYDVGAQFFLWEFATAVAGWRLGVQPFDQPDVEAAKVLARSMVDAYRRDGRLPEPAPTLRQGDLQLYGDAPGRSVGEALRSFVAGGRPGAYVALQAYLKPCPGHDEGLRALQTRIRDATHLPTTVGYGPRFLHSTGQMHKGDAGRGLFVQLTCDDAQDAPIPDEVGSPVSSMTFGVLKRAQALGDGQALAERGRSVLRIHLGSAVTAGLRRLAEAFA